jgi:predicted anti-sigma-YlaC factor YlaD
MNCPDFADAIQRSLDGDESSLGSPAWHEHLQACGRCRRDFAAAQMLRQGLRDLPRPETPATLSGRLVEIVDRDRRFRRRMGWWRNALIFATAASLLAVVGYNLLRPTPAPNQIAPTPELANNQLPKSDDVPRIYDAAKTVTALAQSVQDGAKAPLGVLITAALESAPTPTPIVAEPLDPAQQTAQSLRSAGRNVAETFEPVANSARQAALFFAREIPVDFQMREN